MAVDALHTPHAQQRRRHRGAGVTRRHHGTGLAVAHGLGRTNQRGVLLAAHTLCSIVVHGDDFGCDDERKVATAVEPFRTDENDGDTLGSHGMGAGQDVGGCAVATHRIECDRQHDDDL
jgi:hypothetical protein